MDTLKARRANLRKLLNDRNWSQATAAKELGIAPPQISQVLKGSRNMGEAIARRIEIAAGLPVLSMDQAPNDNNPLRMEYTTMQHRAELRVQEPRQTYADHRTTLADIEEKQDEELFEILAAKNIFYDEIEIDPRVMTDFGPVRLDYVIQRRLAIYVVSDNPVAIDRLFMVLFKLQHQTTPVPLELSIYLRNTTNRPNWPPRPELVRRQLDALKDRGHIVQWAENLKDLIA